MREKYIIFNKKEDLNPLTYTNKNGNSEVLEFNTRQQAQDYIKFMLCENKNFIVSSIDEWHQRNEEKKGMDGFKESLMQITEQLKFINDVKNNNINGCCLPVRVKNNEEYISVLSEKLSVLKSNMNKLAFHSEIGLGKTVNSNCELIISALQDLIAGKLIDADEKVKKLLKKYIKNEFVVSDLEKSYAFKAISEYKDLYSDGFEENFYKKMKEGELSFFRARVISKNEKIEGVKDIISLPFSKRNLSNDLRFSVKNEICLYLGVTSHVCFLECQYDNEVKVEKDLYLSAFKFNSRGKKLKILNLAISEPLINGIYQKKLDGLVRGKLQKTLIEIFPLVIATSFIVKDKDENREKYEYLLSQSIIRVMKELEIDGVAYLSRRGEDDFQFPHGVNLAIPMKDIGESKEYSDLYNYISCTKPILVDEKIPQYKGKERSYINQCYPKYHFDKYEDVTAQISYNGKLTFYGETHYSKIDDYLLNQCFYEVYTEL